ncbi:hypothetical protein GCM10011613_33800 [Cellvibrio zantedeschiae]|uniref:Porin n=1 Tax=Cellvibrio zantedeschiae TaxID=1237077 RepID=A0ABQ3B9Q6_9GAMM|nr:hypothetical protein [Cellvibrio zantedeschiae]GGY86025.1 hypothetical protein GCM10011613_33800 [Cellvibrio zantedeschiae]
MYTHSKKMLLIKLCFFICSIFLFNSTFAEPYLAFKNNLPCSACHINPIGGGARNTYGAYYGTNVLPQNGGSPILFDAGNLSETFRIGANFRANYEKTDFDKNSAVQTTEDSRGFQTQTGQIYIVFQPKDSRFSLYIDEQVAPGGALNRETFVLAKLIDNHYLKAGKIMLPYGIRLQDDSAFIRQASGINFNNSDNGVELGLQYTHAIINLAVTNGSSGLTNDDKRMQYLLRSEYIGNNWRAGASAIMNDAELGHRTMYNIFGGFNWLGFTFLAEVDQIKDESVSHVPGAYETQRVSFFEVNRELFKGLNLKLTTEYLDPDTHINENQRNRHSLLLEYTPFANIQIRGGVRSGKDIPQRVQGNYSNVFAQVHFYY